MKKKLPVEIDDMIWAAAESGDPEAVAEFERRYPLYRAELATRIAMVDVLRSSRPQTETVPSFRPVVPERPPFMRRLVLVPITGALLAGLAFSAFVITDRFVAGGEAAESESVPAMDATVPPGAPMRFGPQSAPIHEKSVHASTEDRGTSPRPLQDVEVVSLVTLPSRVSVLEALRIIASEGRIEMNVMPGVPDTMIELTTGAATISLPATEMLRLVEQRADIHVVDAGPEGILVIPADRVRVTPETAPGSAVPSRTVPDSPGTRND